jgi:peptidoglycan/LPS O-acetylase OafA/YrhL
MGALADFFPFFCFLLFLIIVFVITGRVLDDVDTEHYSDTKPIIWTYIGFVPAIIGGHIGMKHRAKGFPPRTREMLKQTGVTVIAGLGVAYMASVSLAFPYFNYEFAR